MSDLFVAVIVTVPNELFSVDDDISLKAAHFVCDRLAEHLANEGHTISSLYKGGIDEDWGVDLGSTRNKESFYFQISAAPNSSDNGERQMVISYSREDSLFKWLFSKQSVYDAEHHMHESMSKFGEKFESSSMLTMQQYLKVTESAGS